MNASEHGTCLLQHALEPPQTRASLVTRAVLAQNKQGLRRIARVNIHDHLRQANRYVAVQPKRKRKTIMKANVNGRPRFRHGIINSNINVQPHRFPVRLSHECGS